MEKHNNAHPKKPHDFSGATNKISFAALGLIFGTALGAVLALLIGADIYWAGAGTALGLVTGAAIDAMIKRERD